ncbi:hypothetical protein BDL97_11G023800 [Sphagnum fallax]|nr:hypothetical protein BDL97_11G023800 [Sphagnum fallax]
MSRKITLPFPDRYYTGAAYAGLSATSPGNTIVLLYGLFKQATVGPCNLSKWSWNVIDLAKWTSQFPTNVTFTFSAGGCVFKFMFTSKSQQEEDPSWWSKAQELDKESVYPADLIQEISKPPSPLADSEPVAQEEMDNEKLVVEVELNGEDKVEDTPMVVVPSASNDILKVNGTFSTEDVEDVAEGIRAIAVYNEWVSPTVTSQRPSAHYQHAAGVVDNKMYIIGGNHNGHYLNNVDKVPQSPLSLQQKQSPYRFPPCAGHILVWWGTKLLAVAGHSKEPMDTVIVCAFDTHTVTWTILDVYGKSPIAHGGQSVTLVGSTLVMFGGEDSNRHLMDDLNILDLESLTWEAIETSRTRPSSFTDHVAAVHGDHYLFLLGGSSHSSCYDLYMVWSQPQMQGTVPSPCARHAGATIGKRFYIIGGGDNKSISDTLVLNMDTVVWSLVASVKGQTAISSEGLSVVVVEDSLVAFGGYNGHFKNQVHKKLQSKNLESPAAAAAAAFAAPLPVLSSLNGTIICALDNSATSKKLALALKVNEELQEATLAAQAECSKLQSELAKAQFSSSELEQVDVAELRQKLQCMEILQWELDLLQCQKDASKEAVIQAVQKQGTGVWSWLAGSPPDSDHVED